MANGNQAITTQSYIAGDYTECIANRPTLVTLNDPKTQDGLQKCISGFNKSKTVV